MGTFIILLLTGGATAVATLSIFADIIGHETQLHDLRNRVKELQYKHLLYMAKQECRISESEMKNTPTSAAPSEPKAVQSAELLSNEEVELPTEQQEESFEAVEAHAA